jgi:hypothetical protein
MTTPPRPAGRSTPLLLGLLGAVVGGVVLLLLFVGPADPDTGPRARKPAAPVQRPATASRGAAGGDWLPPSGAAPAPTALLQVQPAPPGQAEPPPSAPAPEPAGPDPRLVAQVTRDASAELERAWSTVTTKCPVGEPPPGESAGDGRFELFLTFDADGREIARSLGDLGGPPSGRESCFMALQELQLKVPAPGQQLQVTVRLPRR